MTKQNLHGSQITGRFVDDRRLGSPHRMSIIVFLWQTDPGDPFVNQTSILPGAHMESMVTAAGKHIIIKTSSAQSEPLEQAGARVIHQLELNRSASFLLDHNRPCADMPIANEITDLDLHQVTAPQLAVDGKIEHRSVANSLILV
jgi:hypothetical protein